MLVVEDDEFFRKAICELLRKKNHTVFEAPHGRAAIEIISLQDFELVITDIQMPGMSGVELLEWSVQNKPMPFIIMTGFSTLLETKSAYDLGAKDFISKPFKVADLIIIIDKVLGVQGQLPVVSDASEFCKISINEFVSGKKIEFDVFVKLSSSKYVKIANKGEGLLSERILHYKGKGVNHLYINKDDFSRLVGFNLTIVGKLQGNKKISHEKKVNFLKYTGEIILANAFINGVDKEMFSEAQTFIESTINILTDSKECLDLLSLLNTHSNHLYSHSIGVAMYSSMIAKGMGFESNQAFFKLSLGGIFHDIGKKEIELEILEKHRSLLTVEDKKLIDSHVARGQEIILSIKGIPEDVAQLVYEHHENIAGLGYPMGSEKKHQHPLSKILQLANQFVELAMVNPHNSGMTGEEAIAHLENTFTGRFDEKAMIALKSLFKKNHS